MNINIANGRGIERFVINMLRNLPKNRFNITLIQSDWTDARRIEDNEYKDVLQEIEVMEYKDETNKFNFLMKSPITQPYLVMPMRSLSMIINKFTFSNQIKTAFSQADLVYLTSNSYAPMVWKNRNVIGSCHTFFVRNGMEGKIYGKLTKLGLLNKFDFVHVFPGYDEFFENNARYMCSLPLPIDIHSFFPSRPVPSTKIRLLFVAGLDASKGLDILLKAFMKLDKNHYELHIVGRGGMEGLITGRIDEGIYYHGSLNIDKLGNLYRSSDIFVYPTRSDVYPAVVLEALSSGLYVIASNMLRGIFDNFESEGFLSYCDNDPDNLATTIENSDNYILSFDARLRLHGMVRNAHDAGEIFAKMGEWMYNIGKSRFSIHEADNKFKKLNLSDKK